MPRVCNLRAGLGFRLGTLFLLSAASCRTPQRIADAPAGVAASDVTPGALQLLPDRVMTTAPDRFEPTGQLFGLENDVGCQVWRVDGNAYLGSYPALVCAAWPAGLRLTAPSLHELSPRARKVRPDAQTVRLPSPDGTREAVWTGAELTVRALPGGAELARYTPQCRRGCPPIDAAAWSPDGAYLAVAHNGDAHVQIVRSRDGVVARVRALAPRESALAGTLLWGRVGLVTLARTLAPAEDAPAPEFGSEEAQAPQRAREPGALRAYLWTSLESPASTLVLDDIELGDNTITLDPGGRFLFISGTGSRLEGSLVGYDLRRPSERIAYAHGDRQAEPGEPARVEPVQATWLPGPHPVWETVEVRIPEEGDRSYTAWRLYTAPQIEGPRLERIELREPPPEPCQKRRVQPDGRTVVPADGRETFDSCARYQIDPSAHLRGVSKSEIERTLDGRILKVGTRGCLSTDTGYYSCFEQALGQRFAVGRDPQRALFLRGDQLLPVFFRPDLLADFMEQRDLAAPPRDQALGLPPRLRVLRFERPAYSGAATRAELEVQDGGSGIGQLRIYRDGELLGPGTPLGAGRQTVTLQSLGSSCREVAMYACNAAGLLCSPAAPVSPCAAPAAEE